MPMLIGCRAHRAAAGSRRRARARLATRRRARAGRDGSARSRSSTARLGLAEQVEIGRRQALVIHADQPLCSGLVDRHLDHARRDLVAPHACLSVPARSTQSRLSTTSASRSDRRGCGDRNMPGGAACSAMIGRKRRADLQIGQHPRAEPSRRARRARSRRRSSRDTRPMSISGRFAPRKPLGRAGDELGAARAGGGGR